MFRPSELAVFLAAFAIFPALAGQPWQYVCRKAPSPIRIDGRLGDAAWSAARWTDDFVDIEGLAKPRPRLRTRVKMLWDNDYLYIAAELDEPHVWATVTEHDAVIFRDNNFEVFRNPSGDGRNSFEFEINALNTGWDLFLAKPYKLKGRADNSWEIPGLRTAVYVNGTLSDSRDEGRGWTVEIAFPFAAFASRAPVRPPTPNENWRVNFSRVEWRVEPRDGRYEKVPNLKEDNWVWSPQGQIDMHVPEHWGFVRFAGN